MAFLKKYWISLSVVALVFLKFFFILWQFRVGGFLVAPGGDQYNHIYYIENLDKIFPNFGYPPLFHYLLRFVTNQFWGGDYLASILALAPYFLILPIIMVYFLGKNLFSKKVGLWALILVVFCSGYPLLNFADGSYPDLLNYGIVVPLVLIFLFRSLRHGRWLDFLLTGFFISVSFLTHHFSSITLLASIGPFLLFLILYHNIDAPKIKKNLYKLLFALFIFALFWFFVLKFTFGPSFYKAITNLVTQGESPVISSVASTPYEYQDIYVIVRPIILFFGVAGLAVLFTEFGQKKKREIIFLMIWIAVVWVLSRADWSGLPPRFLRHIDLPLIIASGFFIVYILENCPTSMNKILATGLFSYMIVINTVQLVVPPFKLNDGFYPWVWYRQIDEDKYQYMIKNIDRGTAILTTNSNPYLNYKLSKIFKLPKVNTGDVPICLADQSKTNDQEKCKTESKALLDGIVKSSLADYVFVGEKPYDIDELTFAEFNGYTQTTALLKLFEDGKTPEKRFIDGSKIYKIK